MTDVEQVNIRMRPDHTVDKGEAEYLISTIGAFAANTKYAPTDCLVIQFNFEDSQGAVHPLPPRRVYRAMVMDVTTSKGIH